MERGNFVSCPSLLKSIGSRSLLRCINKRAHPILINGMTARLLQPTACSLPTGRCHIGAYIVPVKNPSPCDAAGRQNSLTTCYHVTHSCIISQRLNSSSSINSGCPDGCPWTQIALRYTKDLDEIPIGSPLKPRGLSGVEKHLQFPSKCLLSFGNGGLK